MNLPQTFARKIKIFKHTMCTYIAIYVCIYVASVVAWSIRVLVDFVQ